MRIERTKNASKSIRMGVLLRVYQMIAPFLMRTAMIHFMGVEYLGLNSLFASILHILNLAELGVGSAMVFSMYKPIAEDDEKTICALMRLYRRYYRLIGLVIGGVGLCLTPVIPELISGEIPEELNLYVLYWLNLGATVLTYWLFAYKNSLLQAHQRTDKTSLVSIVTTTVQYAIQIVILIVAKDYYLFLITALVTQAANNLCTAALANKMYPRYKPQGSLSPEETREINHRIRDLFTGKLGGVIVSSAGSVVISAFLGLETLAIYQNYYFILSSVMGVIEIALQSMTAGLGNSFVMETKEKNYQDLERFSFLFIWLVGVCTCCFLGLYQPFMQLWVGFDLMLGYEAVVCFAGYFLLYSIYRLLNIYKDAAGLWHEDRFRPLLTAAVNLILNLLWIRPLGVYGVLLSTILSVVIVGMPWLFKNIFTLLFDKKQLLRYAKLLLLLLLSTVICAALCTSVCMLVCSPFRDNELLTLIVRFVICLILPNGVYLLLLHRYRLFRPAVQLVDHLTGKRLKLENLLFHKKNNESGEKDR